MVFWTAVAPIHGCDMVFVNIVTSVPLIAIWYFLSRGGKIDPIGKLQQQYGILSHGVEPLCKP